MILVLPEPPIVEVDEEFNRICFYSSKVEGILLDHFEITIYDRTGEQTFIAGSNSMTNCTIVDSNLFQSHLCAPFLVSVKASNSFGFSVTNSTVNEGVTNGNTCLCLENHG